MVKYEYIFLQFNIINIYLIFHYLIYSFLLESLTSILAPFGFNSIVVGLPKRFSLSTEKVKPKF